MSQNITAQSFAICLLATLLGNVVS